jgi:hypothetical protein
MINNNVKTSVLLPSQIPEFIRDDPAYEKFVLFLQSYYEWMEQTGNVLDLSDNLLDYRDIDSSTQQFLDYFYNDFLSYFPKEILADKIKVAKLAKELYESKGTPSSYNFLFRLLFNSDVEFFYTKDAVLRASAGKWYVAKSLKLASTDLNFLKTKQYRIFGETTKSIATIENVVVAGEKMEVFISDMERLFQSGEFVRVVDSNNQDVLFNGQQLRSKVVGQISQIKIDPVQRGLFYSVGDPVILYGGLNNNLGHGATAQVSETTKGSIQRINVKNGGYGYREAPNTDFTISNSSGIKLIVGGVDPEPQKTANVVLIPTNLISTKTAIKLNADDYFMSNLFSANISTKLSDAFNFISFDTYPLSSVIVQNGGGGLSQIPNIQAESLYPLEMGLGTGNLRNLGILAPIQITNGGQGYVANDVINIVGGTGYGAAALVSEVDENGSITSVEYTFSTNPPVYPLGGMGYNSTLLPSLQIVSANNQANGASIYVPGILGDGATFASVADRVGTISKISISDFGEDYISTPNASLRVQDITVKGLIIDNLPQRGDIVYQGDTYALSSYTAYVDSLSLLVANVDPLESLYNIRVYEYNSIPNHNLPLKVDSVGVSMPITNQYKLLYPSSKYNNDGIKTYGDGSAKAVASFLNGLTISNGQYIDSSGQPSSFDVLQSINYNNYTYEITVEKEIEKYRKILLDLLHPTGTKVIGRFAMKSSADVKLNFDSTLENSHSLGYFTGEPNSYATMSTDWVNYGTNVINFGNLVGADLRDFISPHVYVSMTTEDGDGFFSEVLEVNEDSLVVDDYKWLTFGNVAVISTESGSNAINIVSLTGSFDIINNGFYSNTDYPLKDIIHTGDEILLSDQQSFVVTGVDYDNDIIYTNIPSTLDVSEELLSVKRTITTSDFRIYTTAGNNYQAELLTENGDKLVTEDLNIITIG